MAGRSGRRRVDPGSPVVDLDAVFADDALIDAIAGQTLGADAARSTAPMSRAAGASRGSLLTVDPLTELLELWRQELAVEPIPPAPDARRAAAPAQPQPRPGKRTLRPALAIAAAIGALLVGAASIGSKDAPRESPLFALTAVLWPSRVVSVASADQVDAIIVEARTAIQDGRTQDAQLALLRAAVVLGSVDDVDGKGDRQEVVAALWVEVAPQPSSTGFDSPAYARQTTPGTRSAAPRSTTQNAPLGVLAAPATNSTTAAAPPVGAQVAGQQSPGPQVAPSIASSTGAVQAAIGPGWPTAAVTTPPADGTAVTESAAPSTSAAPVAPAVTATPVESTTALPPSVPSTPPPPTLPVDPPAEVTTSETLSATEQSAPAPTPSEPSPTDQTTAADSAGPFASTETATVNKLDPAAASTG